MQPRHRLIGFARSFIVVTVLAVVFLCLSTLPTRAGTPYWSDIEWSPDGILLAAVGNKVALFDQELQLISTTSMDNIGFPASIGIYYYDIHWISNERYIVRSNDFTEVILGNRPALHWLSVWDAEQFEEIDTFQLEHVDFATPVAVTNDGTRLASVITEYRLFEDELLATNDSQVVIYDISDFSSIHAIPYSESVGELSFSPNGTELAYFTYQFRDDEPEYVRFMYVVSGMELHTINLEPDEFLFSIHWLSDSTIALHFPDHVEIRTIEDGHILRSIEIPDAQSHEWSYDQRWLAVVVNGDIQIWNMTTGTLAHTIISGEDEYSGFDSLAWNPSKQLLAATIFFDEEMHLFDLSNVLSAE
jgi:WD40 repeat protein